VGRRYLSKESLAAVLARAKDADTVVEVSELPTAGGRDHPGDGLAPQLGT
jgi:hypothetical protein